MKLYWGARVGLQAAKIHCNAFNWCKIIHADFTVHLIGGQTLLFRRAKVGRRHNVEIQGAASSDSLFVWCAVCCLLSELGGSVSAATGQKTRWRSVFCCKVAILRYSKCKEYWNVHTAFMQFEAGCNVAIVAMCPADRLRRVAGDAHCTLCTAQGLTQRGLTLVATEPAARGK